MTRKIKIITYVTLLVILVVACSPESSATPPPTPRVVQIGIQADLDPWLPALNTCANQIPGIALAIYPIKSQEFSLPILEYDFYLTLSNPTRSQNIENAFVTQIGKEQIIWITHPNNPVTQIETNQIREIYEGATTTWQELAPGTLFEDTMVQTWVYAQDSVLFTTFQDGVWSQRAYPPQANLAPSPAAMLEAVADNPGAIGFIPQSWLRSTSPGVKQILVLPEASLDILAISPDEPEGETRQLLLCLKQTITRG